ncbi:hypothetical protein ACROYT_G004630 [Oculina patagonica]
MCFRTGNHVHLEKRQRILKVVAVFFHSCIGECLTIPAPGILIITSGVRSMPSTLDNGLTAGNHVHLERRQRILEAVVVFFHSCIRACLTIPAPGSIVISCGVRLMPSTLDNGLTAGNVHLERIQKIPKAVAVFFHSCIRACLTIPAPGLIIISCGVRLMPSMLDNGLTAHIRHVRTRTRPDVRRCQILAAGTILYKNFAQRPVACVNQDKVRCTSKPLDEVTYKIHTYGSCQLK